VGENNQFSLHDLGTVSRVHIKNGEEYIHDKSLVIELITPDIPRRFIDPFIIPSLQKIVVEYAQPLVTQIIINTPIWSPYCPTWIPAVKDTEPPPPRILYTATTPVDGHVDTNYECVDPASFVFDARRPSTDKVICVSTTEELEAFVAIYETIRTTDLNWVKLVKDWGGVCVGRPGHDSADIKHIWSRRGYLVGLNGVCIFNTNLIRKVNYFQLQPIPRLF
jgi:hypothetical protein